MAAPAADVHKHYGYAFQWFALCALIVGLYVWFQLIRPRRRAAPRLNRCASTVHGVAAPDLPTRRGARAARAAAG